MAGTQSQVISSGAPILVQEVPDYIAGDAAADAPLIYDLNDYFKDPNGGALTFKAINMSGSFIRVSADGILEIDGPVRPASHISDPYQANLRENGGNVSSDLLQVTATNADGFSVTDSFNVTRLVTPLPQENHAPGLRFHRDSDVAPQAKVGIGYWTHGYWETAEIGNFYDPDGDRLTLTATQADGTSLPSWLRGYRSGSSSDAEVYFRVVGAQDSDIGSYDIRITATDPDGLSIVHNTTFTLYANNNQAPIFDPNLIHRYYLNKVTLDAAQGDSLTRDYTEFFLDYNGENLVYSLAMFGDYAVPDWISIDPTTGVLTATPGENDRGVYKVHILGKDSHGAVGSGELTVTVDAANRAPVLDSPLPDVEGNIGSGLQSVNFAGHFSDVDRYINHAPLDDRVSFSATLADGSPLPEWMTFLSDGTLEYRTNDNANAGAIEIRVTAHDRHGATVSDVFTLTMAAREEGAPFVTSDVPNYWVSLQDNPVIDQLGAYFTDPDGGALSFSARLTDGSALPSWLSLAADGTLSLTSRDKANIGKVSLVVTATDEQGLSMSDVMDVTLTEVPNRAPTINTTTSFNWDVTDEYKAFAATNPSGNETGPITFSDVTTDYWWEKPSWNQQNLDYGTAEKRLWHQNLFSDQDLDNLTLSFVMADGGPWPEWLSIDEDNNLSVSRVDEADQLERVLRITATDPDGAQTSGTMKIVLEHLRNHAPEFSSNFKSYAVRPVDLVIDKDKDLSQGVFAAFGVVDPDGDPLTFSVENQDGTPAPSWFTAGNYGVVWADSDQAEVGVYDLMWVATDPGGLSLKTPLKVTVRDPEPEKPDLPNIVINNTIIINNNTNNVIIGDNNNVVINNNNDVFFENNNNIVSVVIDEITQKLEQAPTFTPEQFDPMATLGQFDSGLTSLTQKPDGSWLVHTRGSGSEATFEAPTIRFGDHEYQLSLEGMQNTGFQTSELRDFDGNNLGANEAWELMGFGDVDGDGVLQYLLSNPELGRWATVNGDMNTGDHGAGGASRVVGIYIDPFVEEGKVELGSEFDSQTRFTNDLKSNNLIALGNIDGDGDGFQDVFFRTNDGTAYLRALMHADGNIQYANYMVWDQLTDWMQQNNVDPGFYDDWQNI